MKYFKQFGWIMIVTCIGEIMKYYIPLPIPASIYGLVLMMALLMTGVVKIEKVYQARTFLIEIMSLMFIPAAVGIYLSRGINCIVLLCQYPSSRLLQPLLL